MRWRRAGLALAAGGLVVSVGSAQSASQAAFDRATAAWDAGRFVEAIDGYLEVLQAPDGAAFVDRVALQTGELYETREVTADGRAPRFSPDGRYIAYETGLEVSRATRVVRNDRAFTPVAELPGVSAAFPRGGDRVAYLQLVRTPALDEAIHALDRTPLAAANRAAAAAEAAWQILAHTAIAERDLSTGTERLVPASGLMKTGLVYGPDGRTLLFLGATGPDADRTDIYALADGASAPVVAVHADGLKSAPVVPGRAALTRAGVVLYVVPPVNPFRRPGTPFRTPGGPAFAVVDAATGEARTVAGRAPTLSDTGSTLAYITSEGGESRLMAGPPFGEAVVVKRTPGRLDVPAFDPRSGRLAYQIMEGDDWEIHVSDIDGTGERRVTRDVQHDVLPQFLGDFQLLGVIGEPRHRRSFVYDLRSLERTRLFHNNTIRTIAPEYQWVPGPDRRALLIAAERDGDTVSPQRGIYLTDLRRKIPLRALVARLETNRAKETARRDAGRRMFAPIADDVRAVLAAASVERVFEYERALFDFASKHISQPGNRLASAYLAETYRSFGYEPELQWFEPRGALPGGTANVIAALPGTVDPDLVYVVSSHYDSVAGGPGADDDSSGTAALLETARVLAGHPLPATVVFASFTGEEAGLLGSREFVRRAVANGVHVAGALNNDMIGWANDAHLDNTIRYSNPGIRDLQHAAASLFTRLVTYDALYFKNTDAAAYYEAYGDIVGGLGSYPVLSNPHYHQPHDLLQYENHDLILETSRTTTAAIMLLASSPSRVTGLAADRRADGMVELRWTPNPETGIVGYRVAAGAPEDPATRVTTVDATRATLENVPAGATLAVKAVNGRGLEGWDWARVSID